MTHTLVIASREVRERTFVLLTAAFIAVIPFAAALLPGARRFGTGAYIGMLGGVLAVGFTLGLAIILGASIVGRDLSERRLSFYFARPVGAAAIWFGKLTGALVLTAVSFAVIFVPAFLAGRGVWSATWNVDPAGLTALVLGGSLFLILVAHGVSTVVRSRSASAAFDLVAVTILAGATWMILRSLFEAMAIGVMRVLVLWLAVALLAALVGGGAWQLSRGRADLRRSHIELSRFVWITLTGAVTLCGAYAAWVFSAGPGDLHPARAWQAGRGDWAVVSGPARMRGDYSAVFLMDVASGRSIPFPQARWHGADFTRAGNAVFAEHALPRVGGVERRGVVLQRFGRDDAPFATGVNGDGSVVLSDDLQRMAAINRETVSIHDIDGQRLLASGPMPKRLERGVQAFFVTPDVLRIVARDHEGSSAVLRILELDVRARRLVETGRWAAPARNLQVRANADGSALMVTRIGPEEGDRVVLLDGRTGEVRTVLPVESAGYWSGSFLADGRIVALTAGPQRALKLLSAEGTIIRDVPLGPAKRGRVVSETQNGHIVLALSREEFRSGAAASWETVVVDVDAGSVVRRESGIRPSYAWWVTDPRVPEPNATGDFIVGDHDGVLWVWNANTGQKRKFI